MIAPLRMLMITAASSGIDTNSLPKPAATSGELSKLLAIVFAVVGALALLMVVVSGMRYILSSGDPRRAAQAKEGVIYAVVGVVIAISAETIISFVLGKF